MCLSPVHICTYTSYLILNQSFIGGETSDINNENHRIILDVVMLPRIIMLLRIILPCSNIIVMEDNVFY